MSKFGEFWKPVAGSLPQPCSSAGSPPRRWAGSTAGTTGTDVQQLRYGQPCGLSKFWEFFQGFFCFCYYYCMKTIDNFIKLLPMISRKSCFSHRLLKRDAFFPLPEESSALPSTGRKTPAPTGEFLHILSEMRRAETQCSRHGCAS